MVISEGNDYRNATATTPITPATISIPRSTPIRPAALVTCNAALLVVLLGPTPTVPTAVLVLMLLTPTTTAVEELGAGTAEMTVVLTG